MPITNRHFKLVNGHDNARGVWGQGSTLWVVENDQSRNEGVIIAYNSITGKRRWVGDFGLSDHNLKIQGIWSDGATMWVADWDDKKIYAYELDRREVSNTIRIPDKDISLEGSNDAPRGVWGAGAMIFVVDKDDTKVYAYSTTDGSRLTDEEFDLDADNGNPWGIWGEGGRVWISDIDDDMLYVYERNPNSSTHGDRVPELEIRLPSAVDEPRGIWSNGQTMWVVDEDDIKMYAMHFRSFRHSADEVDINQVNTPTGLWTNGRTMWVADAGRSDYGKLLAYGLNNGSRRPSKDVQLASFNLEPLSMWSDGTTVWVLEDSGNDFLYAYAMDPASDQVGQLVPYKSITLDSDNADPKGTWSDGDTIWVSDSGDDKLYAYDLADRTRETGLEIDLNSNNDDPGEIWSDGEIIWVMDAEDKRAYSYKLATGTRLKHKEFMTVPDNDNPSGGMTGHELRFWVVDSDDEMLYAYGRLNASPTFSETSANFKIHRTAAAGDYVGSVPEVSDPDGDTITYLLTSGGLGVFRMDPQTGEIFLRDDASGFIGGEEYTLDVAVTDNKSKLGGLSSDADDAIKVTITVTQNADPQFTTADGTVFSVAEDATEDDTIAQLSITDLDGDPLFYASQITPNNHFSQSQGTFNLSNGRTLDYEGTNSYTINIQIRDNKDESGQADFSWDDEIDFTIQVTNVDEDGEIILDSAHPEVATEIVATLTDPDGVDFSNGNQVYWVLEKSTDETNWIEISDADTGSSTHAYTPVTTDRGTYLRFKATYSDGYDTVNAKTTQIQSANKVAAEAPSNGSPRFTEGSSSTRFIAEDAGGGSNVGSPVSATDPDEDTLAYLFVSYSVGQFHGDSETGQILLAEDATLDYEEKQTYYVRVVVLDNLDPLGNADDSFDGTNLVTISVTNVEEAGSVQLSSDSPEVDDEITAELSDPDGSIANLVWVWQTADSSGSTTWTDISGATSDSYTPTVGDIGKYLRARATYDDGEGTGKEATATTSGAVVRLDNAPPTFDEGASATRSINENPEAGTRVGAVVTATDPDGDALTYSLASGADSEKFSIDSASGRLEVAAGAALDFETGAEFEVELQVSDGKATDHSQDNTVDATINLTINLLNVDEPGTVALSSTDPEVGTSITATLNDPDGVDSNDWHWEKSQGGETGWTTIPDASEEDYTPASGDVGMYLRAMAEYTDGEGSGKSANTMTDDSVKSPPVDTSLASLTLGRIPFTFSSNTLEYNLTVPNGKKKTKVIATPTAGSGVSVEITPADLNPNKPGNLVGLEEGENQIIITVSEDQGSASTTYTVLVTREAAETQDPPQQDPPQQDPPSGGRLAEDCENQEDAGLIAYCGTYPFAVVRVEFDGSCTIEWSEWDSEHMDATGYSVLLSQFLYRMYEDENGSNIDYNRFSQIYESCEFRSGEWDCQGALPPMNGWVDWEGNPTENLEFTTNEDLTEWSYAMEEPGRHPAEETYYQWSGDATDPDNEPETITLQTETYEMDLYNIYIFEGNEQVGRETILVHGANGFD